MEIPFKFGLKPASTLQPNLRLKPEATYKDFFWDMGQNRDARSPLLYFQVLSSVLHRLIFFWDMGQGTKLRRIDTAKRVGTSCGSELGLSTAGDERRWVYH